MGLFFNMNVVEFLNTCLYFKDKQDHAEAMMKLRNVRG